MEAEAPLGQPALVLDPAPHARPVALAVAGVRRLPVAAAHLCDAKTGQLSLLFSSPWVKKARIWKL